MKYATRCYRNPNAPKITEAICDKCKETKICFCYDPYNQKFGSINLCLTCINIMFDEDGPPPIKEPEL